MQEQRTERSSCDHCESNRNEYAYRCEHACDPPSFDHQELGDEEAPSNDKEQYPSQGYRHLPRIKMKTVRFQDTYHKNDKLEDLVGQLHDLLVRDREYAMLYM